eukprot:NODE_4037_length_704_cov_55.201527_g3413_i0.p1 GENE.NODE_4037_length_704_cov_55.201527_g3413_i0~~NODE_4037_length_704_cov_55.201527_g3413_i0.p1  ORF type:complete len:185 (+),score=24.02 NODE_4037_length_704_cov_55.201527_g3413_i0:83-637(+)
MYATLGPVMQNILHIYNIACQSPGHIFVDQSTAAEVMHHSHYCRIVDKLSFTDQPSVLVYNLVGPIPEPSSPHITEELQMAGWGPEGPKDMTDTLYMKWNEAMLAMFDGNYPQASRRLDRYFEHKRILCEHVQQLVEVELRSHIDKGLANPRLVYHHPATELGSMRKSDAQIIEHPSCSSLHSC